MFTHSSQRVYVVDLARGFPPETPRVASQAASLERYRGAHLYRLLRPELVKKAPSGPLSPDAFSGFGCNNAKCNRDVRDATNYLIKDVLPQFARDMDSSPLYVRASVCQSVSCFALTRARQGWRTPRSCCCACRS